MQQEQGSERKSEKESTKRPQRFIVMSEPDIEEPVPSPGQPLVHLTLGAEQMFLTREKIRFERIADSTENSDDLFERLGRVVTRAGIIAGELAPEELKTRFPRHGDAPLVFLLRRSQSVVQVRHPIV